LSSRVQGFKGSRVQGFKGSRVQGFKGSRVQGFKMREEMIFHFYKNYPMMTGGENKMGW
jgi:hypothetical protein